MPPTRRLIRRAKTHKQKINLARKRLITKSKSVWYITKRNSGAQFYLADFDGDRNTALWSKHQKDGMSFQTEAGVYAFVSTYLNSRTDIILIQKSV